MSDAPLPQVWPTLRARDARGLIRFLVEAFGFEETVVYGDQPDGSGDVVVHAQLSWPEGGGIMLGSAPEACAAGGLGRPAGGVTCSPPIRSRCTPGRSPPAPTSSRACTRPTTARGISSPAIP